jgi:hypothetical protein
VFDHFQLDAILLSLVGFGLIDVGQFHGVTGDLLDLYGKFVAHDPEEGDP